MEGGPDEVKVDAHPKLTMLWHATSQAIKVHLPGGGSVIVAGKLAGFCNGQGGCQEVLEETFAEATRRAAEYCGERLRLQADAAEKVRHAHSSTRHLHALSLQDQP